MTFMDVWLGYTIFGFSVFSAMFIWAVRARQFSNMDRGRHIPLADQRIGESTHPDRKPASVDKYTWVVLMLLSLAAVVVALVMGLRHG